MTQPNRVRTYLDPDAVGPLPRSALADDSDQLAAARTMLRVPTGATTVEIGPDDVLEIVDPNRKPSSLAPVGFDTGIVLPRRKLGRYVAVALVAAVGLIVLAVVQSVPRPEGAGARAAAASRPAAGAPAAARAEANAAVAVPSPVPAPPTGPAAPASTIGTLRIDSSADGQRVFVDGVALSAPAALLRCGPHDVAVGSAGRTRSIDVPCGGEVTVYR